MRSRGREAATAAGVVALLASFFVAAGAAATGTAQGGPRSSTFGSPGATANVHHHTSPPLRSLAPAARSTSKKIREHSDLSPAGATTPRSDGALQGTTTSSVSAATTPGLGFAGVGDGDYGFAPNAAPP